ncbi:uncharacterized protein [Palaemon carinicauda]|uniref:uncharacterized protein n=1 Tax=Palaemon carinicauda TaxID=392227 RepID=UPI0035B58CBE
MHEAVIDKIVSMGTGVRFLVDTGVLRSLLPRELFRTQRSLCKFADVRMAAANGSAIPTYGYENLTLSFGNGNFNWKSLVADVKLPILEHRQTLTVPAKHGIYHHIKTTGPSVFTKFRRLASDRLAAAKQTFAVIEEMGLCQKASSPWSSPIQIVVKRDGSIPCEDYRRLNMQTEPNHFPLLNIADVKMSVIG